MSVIKYNKLVRDRIPAIIVASGKTCKITVLNDDKYLRMLDAMLDEEIWASYVELLHKDVEP